MFSFVFCFFFWLMLNRALTEEKRRLLTDRDRSHRRQKNSRKNLMATSSVENDVKAPNKAIIDFDKETILGKKFLYFWINNSSFNCIFHCFPLVKGIWRLVKRLKGYVFLQYKTANTHSKPAFKWPLPYNGYLFETEEKKRKKTLKTDFKKTRTWPNRNAISCHGSNATWLS